MYIVLCLFLCCVKLSLNTYIDILDFCDSENRSHMVETEKQLLETGLSTEFEEDFNMAIGKDDSEDEYDEEQNIDDNENPKQNLDDSEDSEQNIHDNEDSDQDMENGSVLSDKDSELNDNEDMSSEETNRINIKSKSYPRNIEDKIENEDSRYSDVSKQSDDSKGLWEDIYGRQRDKKGNIILNKYVPPAARVANTDISVDSEKVHRLERQLKGILNRLAEQNMHTIANQVILLSVYKLLS